jgi:hypothetical protein
LIAKTEMEAAELLLYSFVLQEWMIAVQETEKTDKSGKYSETFYEVTKYWKKIHDDLESIITEPRLPAESQSYEVCNLSSTKQR